MKKVMIGMSGGVDSSVAAALLKNQGYEVVGATMRLWKYPEAEGFREIDKEIGRAKEVCDHLGIEHIVLDFSAEFRDTVVKNFIEEYSKGRTPNPCIVCNKKLKFGLMFERAMELGFDYIATGHYARIEKRSDGYHLLESAASGKDQSYVLYNFTQEILAKTLMPLSSYTKEEVRHMAAELKLPTREAPESMEICFVPNDDYKAFLREYAGLIPKEGDMLDSDGNVIGRHKGVMNYTIGQRKGLGAYGRPMFVMNINPGNNTVMLGEKGMEFSSELVGGDLNVISGGELPKRCALKVRYQAKPAMAEIRVEGDKVYAKFDEPQRAVTPGQAVVFYDGDEVLGGATVL